MRGIVAEGRATARAGSAAGRAAAKLVALVLFASPLAGCYVMQAAGGQMNLIARSRPVDQVLADPATTEATRRRIELAVQAREFAARELGLPDGGNFRRYADLGRPYAVWNVVATPEFSLVPRRWCFPVAGCVTYRGYFHEEAARRYAYGLAAAGDDTLVEGVAAYSTLGHFDDPLLSTMLGWSDARLAGTVFHELAHLKLYVPGDSAFNEGYATVVEAAGLRRWFESRGEATALAAWLESRRRRARFLALLGGTADSLRALYAGPLEPAAMRVEKNRLFGELKYKYTRLREEWGGWNGYDAWFARPLDNADLASIATYDDCVPGLERELAAAGSLEAFYTRAEALARLDRTARHREVCTAVPR
ncbi:MAG: aminopeptidase [Steroidobacteraceae bacterium]